jgi:hypothetical protein
MRIRSVRRARERARVREDNGRREKGKVVYVAALLTRCPGTHCEGSRKSAGQPRRRRERGGASCTAWSPKGRSDDDLSRNADGERSADGAHCFKFSFPFLVARASIPTALQVWTRHVHVHVYLPSRQDAQPQVPWRHNVGGAECGAHTHTNTTPQTSTNTGSIDQKGAGVSTYNKGSRRGCNGDGGALASAGQLDYHRYYALLARLCTTMQGANRQISERRYPQTAEIRLVHRQSEARKQHFQLCSRNIPRTPSLPVRPSILAAAPLYVSW